MHTSCWKTVFKPAIYTFFEYLSLVLFCGSILYAPDMPGYSVIDLSHMSLLVATTSPQLTSSPCGELGACSAVWCSTEQQRGLMSRERGWTLTPAPLFHLYFPWWFNAVQIMYGCLWISWQGLCGPTKPNQNYRRDAECQGMKGLFTLKKMAF